MYTHPFDNEVVEAINSVASNTTKTTSKRIVLEIATKNQDKLKEFRRLMPKIEILESSVEVEEIQSMDPFKVAREKAKAAWEKNNYHPILVEDTSMDLYGLGGLPGPFLTFFISQVEMRRMIAERWLQGAERRAIARTILALYDGQEAHTFEGTVEGKISEKLIGANSFGFDDMFIPKGYTKTFAQMSETEKDKLSMRAKAVKAFLASDLKLFRPVFPTPEPFDSELDRIDIKALTNKNALKFAYQIESIETCNKPNTDFTANNYAPLTFTENKFFQRYIPAPDSKSIGLVVTDVDRAKSRITPDGNPMLWEMGPKRRALALAQRAEYFLKNTDKKVLAHLAQLESGKKVITPRPNHRSKAIEKILAYDGEDYLEAHSLKELGYKKISSGKRVSRTEIAQYGLFNKIGKYPRSYLGVGSLPAVSCWRDVITTSLLGHMPVFIARNNIYAENDELRIQLIKEVHRKIEELKLGKKHAQMLYRNIGVAIGCDPKKDPEKALILHKKAGVTLFRIYTINGDPRVVETAANLRKVLGNKVEIFVGQISDMRQAKLLVEKAHVDGLIFGHGGGRQCTSAVNGMAISAVEDIYAAIIDPDFNETTLIQEGGVGQNIGPLLLLGVDGVLYNQQLTRGTIESGGIFMKDRDGKLGQPYHGSASAPTMIIEAANPKLAHRISASGRTKVPEGKPGFLKYTSKANSMAFWVDEFRHHLARTLADLGVSDIVELRALLQENKQELLRIVSSGAAAVAQAYKS